MRGAYVTRAYPYPLFTLLDPTAASFNLAASASSAANASSAASFPIAICEAFLISIFEYIVVHGVVHVAVQEQLRHVNNAFANTRTLSKEIQLKGHTVRDTLTKPIDYCWAVVVRRRAQSALLGHWGHWVTYGSSFYYALYTLAHVPSVRARGSGAALSTPRT